MDITHGVIFLIQLRWPDNELYRNTVRMTLENVESKILLESYSMIFNDKNGVTTCDEKNLTWYVVGYDF